MFTVVFYQNQDGSKPALESIRSIQDLLQISFQTNIFSFQGTQQVSRYSYLSTADLIVHGFCDYRFGAERRKVGFFSRPGSYRYLLPVLSIRPLAKTLTLFAGFLCRKDGKLCLVIANRIVA